MILKKSDKFMKKAAMYSVEVHFLLFVVIFGASFLPKKEPLLLTDIEIAGEGEFREAMEIARNSGLADIESIEKNDRSNPFENDKNSFKENFEGENQVKNVPEMVDELKVPEEEQPMPESSPLPTPPSQEPAADATSKANSLEPSGSPEPTPEQQQPEPESEPSGVSESSNISEEVTDNKASKVVPIETPDEEEETTIRSESEEAKKKETNKKETKKDEKKAEAEKKKKTDPKKKPKNKSKKKDKSKDKSQSKKKRKVDSVIKIIEKAQKQKNRRQKILDLAEKSEKAGKAENSENAAFDGSKGSGRGEKGNGVGAFGVGTALVESDYEIISGQIYPYWVVPSGVKDAENIVIEIHVELGDNGEVIPSSIKILDEKKYIADQVFRAAADSARRAILQASPLSIPKEKLETFKSITLRFNLKEALAE